MARRSTARPQQRPRWQRGVDATSVALGEVVGKLYVARHFPPEAKAKVRAMVDDLTKAFGSRIDALAWMTPETKAKAKAKVDTLYVGVGYPDKWIDYTSLQIVKGDALGNLQRAELFEYRRQLAKLAQPVDRTEWWMTPQTVNAVNLPLQNALNFPAAILQPPYFDPARDAAANYGAIGATIGHEISHSFDDQGSQFDAQGRLANWWTPQDLDALQGGGRSAGRAVRRLSAVPGPRDQRPPGAEREHRRSRRPGRRLRRVSPVAERPARGRSGLLRRASPRAGATSRARSRSASRSTTDGHSPDAYRAATVRNLDPWYAAFGVTPAQKMYLPPDKRVRVW